jgi:hypothetical protein
VLGQGFEVELVGGMCGGGCAVVVFNARLSTSLSGHQTDPSTAPTAGPNCQPQPPSPTAIPNRPNRQVTFEDLPSGNVAITVTATTVFPRVRPHGTPGRSFMFPNTVGAKAIKVDCLCRLASAGWPTWCTAGKPTLFSPPPAARAGEPAAVRARGAGQVQRRAAEPPQPHGAASPRFQPP